MELPVFESFTGPWEPYCSEVWRQVSAGSIIAVSQYNPAWEKVSSTDICTSRDTEGITYWISPKVQKFLEQAYDRILPPRCFAACFAVSLVTSVSRVAGPWRKGERVRPGASIFGESVRHTRNQNRSCSCFGSLWGRGSRQPALRVALWAGTSPGIPKIHKNPWKIRPIVPMHSYVTSTLSIVLHHLLLTTSRIQRSFP